MKRTLFITILFITLYSSGIAQENRNVNHSDHVGEIAFDDKIDDSAFKTPDPLVKFDQPRYEGEKPAIVRHFKEKYRNEGFEKVNGYFTVCFFVNKEGKAGKFRTQAMDFNYRETEFDKRFSARILQLTKELKGWKPLWQKGMSYSYYCYLNFKVVDGDIKEITP